MYFVLKNWSGKELQRAIKSLISTKSIPLAHQHYLSPHLINLISVNQLKSKTIKKGMETVESPGVSRSNITGIYHQGDAGL